MELQIPVFNNADVLNNPPVFFLQIDKHLENDPAVDADENILKKKNSGILCLNCRHHITHDQQRISIGGSHIHSFANPHGVLFNIGCFTEADGCMPIGEKTGIFTWFPGYSWQIVHCTKCGEHLGWVYENNDAAFFGLIINKLASAED